MGVTEGSKRANKLRILAARGRKQAKSRDPQRAAAKSLVELNPESHFQVWSFNAREKASGAEWSGVVRAWAASKRRNGTVKGGDGSFSRQSFSEDQRGGHTAAMAHREVSAESVEVA